MKDLFSLTAHELIENGSPAPDTLSSLFGRIDAVEKDIKAFVHINRKAGPDNKKGRLAGIPVLIKDNICVNGEETTCGSRILKGFKKA
jgi:aspartyl-tRNA(Asn)/glutamyl-tRNA(Gln) amidotransferase subunit A